MVKIAVDKLYEVISKFLFVRFKDETRYKIKKQEMNLEKKNETFNENRLTGT